MLTEAHNEREVFRTRLEETTVELGKACAERDCIRAELGKACDEREVFHAELKETIDDLERNASSENSRLTI